MEHSNTATLIACNHDDPVHHTALVGLIFDFLNITEPDEESDHYTNGSTAYMLQAHNKFVGGCVYRVLPDPTVVYIRALTVLSTERGRHYGYQLLSSFINDCRAKSFRAVQLAVNANNQVAIALYKQLNFKTVREGVDDGRRFFCMELDLNVCK